MDGDERPAGDGRAEAGRAERQQGQRQQRHAIAERERECDGRRFEQAGGREAGGRGRPIARDERIEKSTDADADQRDRQDEAEGEDRSAEQRREQPVPDEFHQEEREADGA